MKGMSRVLPSPALLLLAATGIGAADGYYTNYGNLHGPLVALGIAVGLGLIGVLVPRTRLENKPLLIGLTAAVFVTFGILQWRRTVGFIPLGTVYDAAHHLSVALPALGLVILAVRMRWAVWAWRLFLLAFATASVLVLQESDRPYIDVWFLLTHASQCTTHLCNPYTMTTPDSPGVAYSLNYLPGSFLFLTPFRVLYGDVRYGLLFALVVAAVALRRLIPGRAGLVAGCLALTVPGTIFGIERSWLEPLLFALIVLTLLAWQRNHTVWTVILLAAAFATKQHMLLLAPLAVLVIGWRKTVLGIGGAAVIMLPWFIASPSAMYDNTVTFFLRLPIRVDALSVYPYEPAWTRPILPIAALVIAYAVIWFRVPRNAAGFLVGSALILAGFALTNKISFYNEWALPAMLLLAGATAMTATQSRPAPDEMSSAEQPSRSMTSGRARLAVNADFNS